jgi:hypothetical protein
VKNEWAPKNIDLRLNDSDPDSVLDLQALVN